MCQIVYDGQVTIWRERRVAKCRKEHRCATCGERISVGSTYVSVFCVFEGDASSEAQCMTCFAVTEEFAKEHRVGHPFPSSLLDFIDECVDYGDERSAYWATKAEEIRDRRPNPMAG